MVRLRAQNLLKSIEYNSLLIQFILVIESAQK